MSRRGRIELSEADRTALADGTVSMTELAARFGVGRSAMSAYIKRHGIKHSLRPGSGVRAKREESTRLLAQLSVIEDEGERHRLILNFRAAILLNALDEASRIAAAGNLGPKSLRDLASAVTELETRMVALGLIPGENGDTGKLTSLSIQVMSAEEAASIRRAVEAEQASVFGEAHEPADANSHDADEILDLGAAVSEAVARRSQESAEVINLVAVRRQLGEIEVRHGRAGLRALALRLGVQDDLPRHDVEAIKTLILARLQAEPMLADKIAA